MSVTITREEFKLTLELAKTENEKALRMLELIDELDVGDEISVIDVKYVSEKVKVEELEMLLKTTFTALQDQLDKVEALEKIVAGLGIEVDFEKDYKIC